MDLTPQNIEYIFKECLFKEGENTDHRIEAEGISFKAGFHPERLKYNESSIEGFLNQLSEEFKEGWSFLNMCVDNDGEVWTGEHRIVEILVVLGIAIGKLSFLFPREQWSLLPGGMPYILINK